MLMIVKTQLLQMLDLELVRMGLLLQIHGI